MKILIPMLILAILFTGCTILRPSDTVIVDNSAGNAAAQNRVIQADPNVPAYVKQWMLADTAQWQWFSDIAHWRTPTTAPVK